MDYNTLSQSIEQSLHGKPTSRNRKLAALKGLLSFGCTTGYLRFNVGTSIQLAPLKDELAQRILTEEQVIRLIEIARDNKHDHVLLGLLYHCGLRVSEIVFLQWNDLVERAEGGRSSKS